MRLQSLDLLAFGAFTDFTLDFSGPATLHVVYGPNEAGKTTALRALTALLFGIPERTQDSFRHDYARLRIGGTLARADEEMLAVTRRKGRVGTLRDANTGAALDEFVLAPYLGGIEERQFAAMFGIDHAALRRGGEGLLQQNGEVGQSLFAASLGGQSVHRILQELRGEADTLFRVRGQGMAINAILREHSDAKGREKAYSLSARDWQTQYATLSALGEERDALTEVMGRLMRERSRLQRIRAALPGLARRRELLAELQTMANVRVLPEGFAEDARQAEMALASALETETRATAALARLQGQLDGLDIPEALLAEDAAISDLHQRLSSHRKAAHDRGGLVGQRTQAEADALRTLGDVPGAATLEDAAARRVPRPQRVRLRELGDQFQRLAGDRAQASKAVEKLTRDLATTKEHLAGLPPPVDIQDLCSTVARLRQRGDLVDALCKAETELASLEGIASRALSRLGYWSGTVEDAGRLLAPSAEAVDQAASTLQRLEADAARLSERRDAATQELAAVLEQLVALRLGGDVPTEADLTAARERRDVGWQLVKRAWASKEDVPVDAADYEGAVATADAIADQMRLASERVAQRATQLARQQKIKGDLARIEADDQAQADARHASDAAWVALWTPASIDPGTPAEMRGWLGRMQALIVKSEQVLECRTEVASLRDEVTAACTAMGAALASAGDASSDNAPLPSLIDRAQRLVNRRTEETQRRDELAGRQAALTADLAEASAEERQIQEVWAAWEASWAEGTAALCLPRASPAETFTALEVLDEVLAALDRAKDFRARIEGIDRDALAYAAELASLCERLGLAHDGRGAEAIISDMHARLTRACTDMTKRAQLLDARKSERETLAGASETRETMTARLADLCLVAECGGPDGLTGAIEASRRLGGLHAELAVHERQLVEQGEGLTLVALEAEATDADADDLAARLADLDRQFNEADARRGELDRQIGDARTQLAGMAGGMQAAEAADEAQSALARLRPQVERYLRLRLAARLLREEIERYRKANESPVLARAGAIFADLTLGGFADIRTEYGDDDRPVLVGVRASDEVVPVAGMSDGTLDQLYLALRLATLERYLIANEPLPFVVDDILITFDDARAEAALRVLAEFSRLTQVIIFTHHSRVVDLAHASIGTGTFGVVRLGTTPVPRT